MDFSEGFVALPQHPAWHRRRSARHRPDAVLPAAVAGDAVLIRTDTAAVWVGSLRAYPNGFEFTLRALRGGATYCALRLRAHDDDASVLTGDDLVPALLELLRETLEEQ